MDGRRPRSRNMSVRGNVVTPDNIEEAARTNLRFLVNTTQPIANFLLTHFAITYILTEHRVLAAIWCRVPGRAFWKGHLRSCDEDEEGEGEEEDVERWQLSL